MSLFNPMAFILRLSSLYICLASLVLIFPENEVMIWLAISIIVFIPATLIAAINGIFIEKFLAVLSLPFIVLIPMGMPGTLIGWIGSLLLGLLAGRYWFRNISSSRYNSLFYSLMLVPFFGLNILYILASGGISFEDQSNYFQSASINYANSLFLGAATLAAVCSIAKSNLLAKQDRRNWSVLSVHFFTYLLFCFSLFYTVAMDYRTGVIGSLGLLAYMLSRLPGYKSIILVILLIVLLLIYSNEIVAFLVPGRDEIGAVMTELTDVDNRLQRAIDFAYLVIIDKSGFDGWSMQFSVSALSDLAAVLFPFSIFLFAYLLLYFRNLLFLILRTVRIDQKLSLFFLYASGTFVSLMQPDFFNLFVLGFQISLCHSLTGMYRIRHATLNTQIA